MKKATLSLCMIVKNEAHFLQACLESVKAVVDQMVIVDTGSTDRTLEIASAYNAEIYTFDWCNDFSAARNASIQHATGDWILWMDADERLQKSSLPELEMLLVPESAPVAYRVFINSIMDKQKSTLLSCAHRLFNNHKGVSFSGRIHEQVSPSIFALGGTERKSKIFLEHLGYDLDLPAKSRKAKRNRKLLKRMVVEEPRNAYAHYTLGQNYAATRNWENALGHYEKAYALKTLSKEMTASLLNKMGDMAIHLSWLARARKFAKESIQAVPLQVVGYYLLYRIAKKEQDYEEASQWFQQLKKNNRLFQSESKHISTDVLIDPYLIETEQARLYQLLGMPDKASVHFQEILEKYPDKPLLREEILSLALQMQDWKKAEEQLEKLNALRPHHPPYIEAFANVLIKQTRYRQAIQLYEGEIGHYPDQERLIERLVGLYAKIGEREKATDLLMAFQAARV